VWVGHSCPTLLVLVLISRAAEAGAFYTRGRGTGVSALYERAAPEGTAFGGKEGTQRSSAGRVGVLRLRNAFTS
jgi:hypothetical protein